MQNGLEEGDGAAYGKGARVAVVEEGVYGRTTLAEMRGRAHLAVAAAYGKKGTAQSGAGLADADGGPTLRTPVSGASVGRGTGGVAVRDRTGAAAADAAPATYGDGRSRRPKGTDMTTAARPRAARTTTRSGATGGRVR